LSQAHRAATDGLQLDNSVSLINHDNVIIWKGIIFKTIETMKICLIEYAVFHHYPFIVKHLDENKRYIVICHRDYPWTEENKRTTVGGLLMSLNITLVLPRWMIRED
jgi:hypothetical protein